MNAKTRWLMLIVMMLYMLIQRSLIRYFDWKLLLILSLYCAWCFFTSYWSIVPILSIIKSLLLFCMISVMVSAGVEWVKRHSMDDMLGYLRVVACFFLLSGYLRYLSGTAILESAFMGLTGNPNMFGFMMAAIFPLFCWETYRHWSPFYPVKRLFWLFLLVSCVFFLFASMTRSAILMSMSIFIGFIISLDLNKKILLSVFGMISLLFILIVYPPALLGLTNTVKYYLLKGNVDSGQIVETVLENRRLVWSTSYEAAKEGGWFGVGYAATVGQNDFTLNNRLNSANYGREKGNSQLAVIEETGVIGFIGYLSIMGLISYKLVKVFFMALRKSDRVLIGIIAGTFFGMIAQSIFEGWWDAPGGPDSVYFWVLIGVIRGLEIRVGSMRLYVTHQNKAYAQSLLAHPA